MDWEQLRLIIEEMKQMMPRKAKKLIELIKCYRSSEDEAERKTWKYRIHAYIFEVFASCLQKESKNELYSLCLSINEACYDIETATNHNWHIGESGITRLQDKEKPIGFIPRTYKEGFHIERKEEEDEKDELEHQREELFMHQYGLFLNIISRQMDRKEELITYDYVLKPKVEKHFAELLIDYLGLTRIPEQKELPKQKVKTDQETQKN